ncbi:hypothetical protein EMIHUDRAFT_432765 [Emiliania huxleyi CCMP1516]|uniref:CS domain-containing protein n=2 Tax=Emiliania huxleyi TaxID=2903 RepID=A0A0D3IUK8_EMIH1|nr:hypothetical protein EMIHUDRAFT_432765 [Emiliania huxleyi CCMP1516]EOD14943.1 hypothetical protein EMIHUDRAFT_432765 [Emiliania huxleyi CCMP1516]|eukprot:XP_005767372.1 hypothetical protein EMIHUDRAFT_432765 [Emiliania huxleyi CCMP1516]
MPELTPTLIWAQRASKVFVTFEQLGTTDVKVSLTAGLFTLSANVKDSDKSYKIENMPLWDEIDEEGSTWFQNDRAVVISLKKNKEEWWDGLTKEKSLKRFIKVDFAKWCDEDDKEYTGEDSFPGGGYDEMGGMGGMMGGMGGMGGMMGGGMGGMGGMDMDKLMAGMGGMGGGDFDGDDDDALDDIDHLPGLPSLADEDGPPPLEDDASKAAEAELEEVD